LDGYSYLNLKENMSDKSPLFVSSLELPSHATKLYANRHPGKFKLAILHLANAIELKVKQIAQSSN